MRLEVFFPFFPMSTIIKGYTYFDQFYICLPKQMSSRNIFTRSENGIIIESSSFVDQFADEEYYSEEQSPALVMYEILFHAIMKQVSKPFQLLKQFVLFSDTDSSIDAGYKHMRRDMEIVMQNMSSTYQICRKKMLITGFISIKMLFEKKVRIEHAYRNVHNLTQLFSNIRTVSHSHLKLLYWEGFGMLYQNFKGQRLSKISLSKIEIINLNNQFESKDIEDIRPFLTSQRTNEIEHINSLLIGQNNSGASLESQRYEQHHHQEHFQEERRRLEKKEKYKGYQINRGRLVSDKSNMNGNSEIDNLQNEREQLDGHFLVTNKKGVGYVDRGTTNKQKQSKQIEVPEVQQIYLIRDFSKKRGPPTNYIKIPVATENVKIIEIQTEKKKKKKRSAASEKQSYYSQHQCKNCKYCAFANQHKEFMRHVMERLQVQKVKKSIVTENIVINEFSSSGLDNRYYQPEIGISLEQQTGNQYYSSSSYPRENIKIIEQSSGQEGSKKDINVDRHIHQEHEYYINDHNQVKNQMLRARYLQTPIYNDERKVNKTSDLLYDNYRSEGGRIKEIRGKTQGQYYDQSDINNINGESTYQVYNKGHDNAFGNVNIGFKTSSKEISGGYIHEPMNLEYNRNIIEKMQLEAGNRNTQVHSYSKKVVVSNHQGNSSIHTATNKRKVIMNPQNAQDLQIGTSLEYLTGEQRQSRSGYVPAQIKVREEEERNYVIREGSHELNGQFHASNKGSHFQGGNAVQHTVSKKYISSSNAEAQDTASHAKGPYQRRQGSVSRSNVQHSSGGIHSVSSKTHRIELPQLS